MLWGRCTWTGEEKEESETLGLARRGETNPAIWSYENG